MKTTLAMCGNHEDPMYDEYLQRIQQRFLANIKGGQPLFTTNATDLWETYLWSFSEDVRQFHNCHVCKTFIARFGGLVTIDQQGRSSSAIWHEDDAPNDYKSTVSQMVKMLARAKVTGVFLSSEKVWGLPVTGVWRHFAVTPPKESVYRRSVLTAGQAVAEKKQDFLNMITALKEFTPEAIDQAVSLLKTDSLYRSEKCLGAAEWLADLHKLRGEAKGVHAKNNILWYAVATAPPGFCHPRSSMIGTLLEDISSGLSFAEVSRRFKEKMHPLQYQRPQAAPSSGTIAQAEKLVEQMGIAASLQRRFARLDEVEAIWKPTAPEASPATPGVFSHLKPKASTPALGGTDAPPITMTWEKFARTVLPEVEEIEYLVKASDSFNVLVTAADPEAPPILQWDKVDRRNPVSWYFWHGGAPASQFRLAPGFCKVSAVTLKPSMWYGNISQNQGAGVVFLLEGARETKQSGLALFPEILKSELHAVRSVIEAFSREGKIEGLDAPMACGIGLTKGNTWTAVLRVRAGKAVVQYKLDRWD